MKLCFGSLVKYLMSKLDFKIMFSLWSGRGKELPIKTLSTKKKLTNFRKFGVNYSVFTEGAIFT